MTYSDEQRELLWASAEHWLENWENPENARIYADDCPCCEKYYEPSAPEDENCDGCPIAQYTGERYCANSPWSKVNGFRKTRNRSANSIRYKSAIEEEYRFLVALALGEKP
jgi:hypothetical protein